MKVYGLTGGIGMGKSTSGKILRERGMAVVDTDVIARQLVEPGQPALVEIQQIFGPAMIAEDGRLRRAELARRVFGDDAARKQLEQILHPRIRALWHQQIAEWRPRNLPAAVVIIPLLFETGAAREVDETVCVACSAGTQFQRLLARGWDREQINNRIRAQWPTAKKMELAGHVVWSEGSIETHAEQLDRIFFRAPPTQ